jgi:cell wall assembly regulator SMI1
MDRAAKREYNRLVESAVDAVPTNAPKPVLNFMRKKVKRVLSYGADHYLNEFNLMAHLWALLGYQNSVSCLCQALLLRGVHDESVYAPNSITRAFLAWPAEYTNLIGYAHLFNRTTTPFLTLSKEVEPIYSTDDPTTRKMFGTPGHPGNSFSNAPIQMTRMVIDEMIQLSAFRLSAVGNDFGWDRARFDQELETDAYAMRIVLGADPAKPSLPQDLNVTIPEGFTTFHDSVGPNLPAPGLQHLPPPNPTPPGLFPPDWFTTPTPSPTPTNPPVATPSAPTVQATSPSEPEESLPPMDPQNLDSVWDRIEALLGDDAEDLLNPAATDEEINELETQLNQQLPTDVRDSLKRHNGMDADHDDIPGTRLLSTEDIYEEWDANNDAYADTNDDVLNHPEIAADVIGFPDGLTQPGIWNTTWIPITADGLGNNMVTDLNPGPNGTTGQILTINHDQPHTGPTHPNLTHLLSTWATNLNT